MNSKQKFNLFQFELSQLLILIIENDKNLNLRFLKKSSLT